MALPACLHIGTGVLLRPGQCCQAELQPLAVSSLWWVEVIVRGIWAVPAPGMTTNWFYIHRKRWTQAQETYLPLPGWGYGWCAQFNSLAFACPWPHHPFLFTLGNHVAVLWQSQLVCTNSHVFLFNTQLDHISQPPLQLGEDM